MTPRGFYFAAAGIAGFMGTMSWAGLGYWSFGILFYALCALAMVLAKACRYDGWPTKEGARLWREKQRRSDA